MDNQLQQRLIGAIVLVSLGVIIIPALLDGAGYRSRHEASIEIPEEPGFPPLTQLEVDNIKSPAQVRIEKQKKEVVSKPANDPKKTATEPERPPLKAWALQVATFAQETNALVLQDKLRADGHPAYVTESQSDGKSSFKVRIGPIVDRKRAESLEKTIKASHQLDGYIVTHP